MSNAYLGPFPNVEVTVRIYPDPQNLEDFVERTVNVPNTEVFNVTQQAALTEAPTDLRTAQRSLTFAEDPRMKVREADYPGYTVAVIERAIQQETSPDSWSVMEPTATAAVGTQVRYRARVQVYDAAGAAYEAPVDLFSGPLTVVAHTAPGAMTAGSVSLTSIESSNGDKAQATINAYPAETSSYVTGFDYSIDGGSTTAGTVQQVIGSVVQLTLAPNAANQVVHVRTRDADGGVAATWTQLTDTATTSQGAEQLSIRTSRTTAYNPGGVFFSVSAVGFDVEDPLTEIRYKWTFSDPGHYTRHPDDDMPWDRVYDDAGTTKIVRGPQVFAADGVTLLQTQSVPLAQLPGATFLGNDRNLAYGPHCVHVFENPGSYVVTVEALTKEMALADTPPITQTVTITINDIFSAVAANRVYCIRGNAPAGAEPVGAQVFTNYVDAFNAYRDSAQPLMILLRRGQTIPVDNNLVGTNGTPKPSILHIGAYGPEADGDPIPSMLPKMHVLEADTTHYTVTGLSMHGGFSPFDPYAISAKPPSGISENTVAGQNLTIWDCDIQGFWANIQTTKNSRNVVVGNCHIHSWASYGAFLGGGTKDSGFCGCWIKQPVGTKNDPRPSNTKDELVAPFYADHSPFRCSMIGGAMPFNLVAMTSLNSWFAPDYQPVIRHGGSAGGDAPRKSEVIVDRMLAEYGTMTLTGNYGGNVMPKHNLFDKFYSVVSSATNIGGVMVLPASGETYRNGIMTIMNQPQISKKQVDWIRGKDDPIDPSVLDYGLDIYSNTLIDLRDDTNGVSAPLTVQSGEFAHIAYFLEENNHYAQPGRSDYNATTHPLDTTPLYQLNYPGRWTDTLDTSFAVPANTPGIFTPLSPNPAYQGATTGKVAIDDFWGKVRGPTPSKGATEPV